MALVFTQAAQLGIPFNGLNGLTYNVELGVSQASVGAVKLEPKEIAWWVDDSLAALTVT